MTYQELWHRLVPQYNEGEAKAVARMVYEIRYGLTLSDLLMGRDKDVPHDELEPLAVRLEQGEPVQYVLGVAEFCGRSFHVESGVLIPRPETTELCRLIARQATVNDRQPAPIMLLDIGTGSGSIAITLALELPQAEVTAWDISDKALQVARGNAERLGAHVLFKRKDALLPPDDNCCWDIIVSNPPYVCEREKEQMETGVLDWEPSLALFVPDDNPLLFYRSIGRYAMRALKPEGRLFLEINEHYGEQTAKLLKDIGFRHVAIAKDFYDKDRFVTAYR